MGYTKVIVINCIHKWLGGMGTGLWSISLGTCTHWRSDCFLFLLYFISEIFKWWYVTAGYIEKKKYIIGHELLRRQPYFRCQTNFLLYKIIILVRYFSISKATESNIRCCSKPQTLPLFAWDRVHQRFITSIDRKGFSHLISTMVVDIATTLRPSLKTDIYAGVKARKK